MTRTGPLHISNALGLPHTTLTAALQIPSPSKAPLSLNQFDLVCFTKIILTGDLHFRCRQHKPTKLSASGLWPVSIQV